MPPAFALSRAAMARIRRTRLLEHFALEIIA